MMQLFEGLFDGGRRSTVGYTNTENWLYPALHSASSKLPPFLLIFNEDIWDVKKVPEIELMCSQQLLLLHLQKEQWVVLSMCMCVCAKCVCVCKVCVCVCAKCVCVWERGDHS